MDSTEERTFTEERVRVDQRVETEEFPVPAVVLEVTSSRGTAAPVRLSVDLSAEIETDAVGFHPDYGHQHWSVDGRTLVFERRFGPDESFTTVFAVRGIDDPSDLLLDDVDIAVPTDDEPRAGAPPEGDDDGEVERVADLVDESETQAVRELITGERDELPGLDDATRADLAEGETANGDAAEADGDVETIELSEPEDGERAGDAETADGSSGRTVPAAGPDGSTTGIDDESLADVGGSETGNGTAAEAAGEPTGETAGDAPAVASGAGRVVDALVAEIRAGDLSEHDRAALRDALGDAERGSTAARVDHLQQRMSDIEAYTGALESFLDEHGTGQEIIAELREEVDSFDAELADLRQELGAVSEEFDAVHEEFDAVHEELSTVGENVAGVEDQVGDVEADVSAVEDEVDDVRGAVDDVDAELDEIKAEIREEIREEIAADVREELTADLTAVREELDEEIEGIREELTGIEQFRERVAAVFGGDGSLDDL